MRETCSSTGYELREMFSAATAWLEKSASDIDAINVFPVPDGDTGANMLLTMRHTMEEAYRAWDHSTSSMTQAMARGALMGARGNSGVILSQILRGFARGLEGKETLTPADLAAALQEAANTAYMGLSHPVEGTILTVIRDAASAAQQAVFAEDSDLISVMETVVKAAGESVARTPTLLPVLHETGVVDAGGQGLYVILEGILYYLKGEGEQLKYRKPQIIASSLPLTPQIVQLGMEKEEPYGYCTEFLLSGEGLSPEEVTGKLEDKGQSLIVVGDESNIRVHIHTLDPGSVLHYAVSLGTLHQIKIQNMDDQHVEFLEMQKERAPEVDIAIIPVVVGGGLVEVFKSLGAGAIVPGGQTMNPSVSELLEAIESVPASKAIILTNNKNIILTANQAVSLTSKKVEIVPTRSIPQGVAALLDFNFDLDVEANAEAMREAASRVKTVEVTKAIRSTQIGGLKIREGQAIGLLDDELVVAGDSATQVLTDSLAKAGIESAEVVTIYYGADIQSAEVDDVVASIKRDYSHLEIETIYGGQPHYDYIVSLE